MFRKFGLVFLAVISIGSAYAADENKTAADTAPKKAGSPSALRRSDSGLLIPSNLENIELTAHIADDNKINCEVLRKMILRTAPKARVTYSLSGEKAFEAMYGAQPSSSTTTSSSTTVSGNDEKTAANPKPPFDVFFCDYSMPGWKGPDTLRNMNQHVETSNGTALLPGMIFTYSTENETCLREMESLGSLGAIGKPAVFNEVSKVIKFVAAAKKQNPSTKTKSVDDLGILTFKPAVSIAKAVTPRPAKPVSITSAETSSDVKPAIVITSPQPSSAGEPTVSTASVQTSLAAMTLTVDTNSAPSAKAGPSRKSPLPVPRLSPATEAAINRTQVLPLTIVRPAKSLASSFITPSANPENQKPSAKAAPKAFKINDSSRHILMPAPVERLTVEPLSPETLDALEKMKESKDKSESRK